MDESLDVFSGDEWTFPLYYRDTNQWMKSNITSGLKVWTKSDENVVPKKAPKCLHNLGDACLFYWAFSSWHVRLKPCDILNLFLIVYDDRLLWKPTYIIYYIGENVMGSGIFVPMWNTWNVWNAEVENTCRDQSRWTMPLPSHPPCWGTTRTRRRWRWRRRGSKPTSLPAPSSNRAPSKSSS